MTRDIPVDKEVAAAGTCRISDTGFRSTVAPRIRSAGDEDPVGRLRYIVKLHPYHRWKGPFSSEGVRVFETERQLRFEVG